MSGTNSVIVKNKGKADFVSRYGGVDYDFPAGQSVPISFEAANHIFGAGIKGKDREEVVAKLMGIAHRHGWHIEADGNGRARFLPQEQVLKRFNDFEISAAKLVAADDAPSRGRKAAVAEDDEE